MMSPVTAFAEAIADGREPDWSSIDPSSLDPADEARLIELRAIAEIGRCLSTLSSVISQSASDTAGALRTVPQPTPVRWGHLQIRERVGRGRFGDVYRAWDPAIDRDVALKLLRRERARPASDSAVVHEGRLMGRVRHPNVVTIHGAAHHDGWTGLWMEFIEGRTLDAELRDRGRFSAAAATQVGIELCRALGAVHGAGLVHRDVKAQNVLRDHTGRVVLGDFGTGLELDDTGDAGLAGTPAYLAPEVFRRETPTPASDLYSLGVLLFHLVTESFPVRGRSLAEIRDAHASGRQTRLAADDRVPAAFAAVVNRALSPTPSHRFERAQAMERALADSLEPRRDAAAANRWRPGVVVVAAVAVLAVVASLVPGLSGRRRGVVPAAMGPAVTAGTVESDTRKLSRVPAPSGQFWGQPSRDGRRFSHVDMNGDVGVFDPISGVTTRLTDRSQTGGTAYHTSTFSPDGLRVAYGWEAADGTRELQVVSVAGGMPSVRWRDRERAALPIDWSEHGDQILCAFEENDGRLGLGVMSLSSGAVTMIAGLDSGFTTARFGADDRSVVFDGLQDDSGTNRDVFVVEIDRPEPRRLVAAAGDDFGPLVTPDRAAVLFVSDRTGEPSIWSVPLAGRTTGGAPTILHRNIGRIVPNGLSSSGALYYTLQVGLVEVFQATFDPNREPVVDGVQPVAVTQVGSKTNADWSPDGRKLAYISLPHAGVGAGNSRRLAILDVPSGAVMTLNPSLASYGFPRWSPDGRSLLVKGSDTTRTRGAFIVDVTSGSVEPLALVGGSTPQEVDAIQWGPDSRTVLITRNGVGLFSVDRETRTERLLFDFASEGITRFTPLPGFRLSRDGRSIAYSAYRKNPAGADETVLRVKSFGQPGRDLVVGRLRIEDWTAEGDVLFTEFIDESQRMMLSVISPKGSPPRRLGFEYNGLRSATVHPGGRQISFTGGFPGSEIWSLEHFLPGRD